MNWIRTSLVTGVILLVFMTRKASSFAQSVAVGKARARGSARP